MNYSCSSCGRAFICDETISFCPFCGRAYAAAGVQASAATQRIVIGSDSERTVQEKYWKKAQAEVNNSLLRLRRSLPRFALEKKEKEAEVPREYRFAAIEIQSFAALKRCTSIATFKNRLAEYVSALDRAFGVHAALLALAEQNQQPYRKAIAARRRAFEAGEWSIEELEDRYSVDIEHEEEFIDGFCRDIAEAVGCMSPGRIQPELDYDPDHIDWMEIMKDDEDWKELPKITPAHLTLLDAIKKVLPQILQIVTENGLFVTSAMPKDANEKFNPARETEELLSLAERDYDPIFGESPEQLIEAFSRAVIDMSQFENELPDYEDLQYALPEQQLERLKRELDGIKLHALYGYIEKWRNALDQELDRAYQGQNEDMVDVYNAVEKLAGTLV